MAGLLYYLPAPASVKPEDLRAIGLGYVLEEAEGVARCETDRGPDGSRGHYFAPPSKGERGVPARGEHARWSQLPGSPAWVGFDPGSPPAPIDLERPRVFRGHLVELGDGQRWHVPAIRLSGGVDQTILPRRLTHDGNRWTEGEVLERYRDMWDEACRFWDQLTAALAPAAEGESTQVTLTLDDETSTAANALALNYRLGPGEISALGLFTTETAVEVLKAMVDWPTWEELAQGNAPGDEPGSSPGSED